MLIIEDIEIKINGKNINWHRNMGYNNINNGDVVIMLDDWRGVANE